MNANRVTYPAKPSGVLDEDKLDRFRLSVRDPVRDTLALVLAGGRGKRLQPLTNWRTKPAIPFGGKFRIIDFSLSNCINSGIRHIGILTQYKAHTLIQHLQKGWSFFNGEFNEFVELLPAQQRILNSWYQGTADAVYQNMDIIRGHRPEYVLILAGDHIYKADYRRMINFHIENDADMVVGCVEVPLATAREYGVMGIDHDNRVVDFQEKPEQPRAKPDDPAIALASMGIYLFNTEFLFDQLIRDADRSQSSHDFGKDIIPATIGDHRIMAYPFFKAQGDHYWRDVGTIDAYYNANMELIDVTPELNLYDEDWPIWTYQQQLPPAKFVFDDESRRGVAADSMVSGGCIVSGATVRRSILFSNVRVGDFSIIDDSVILSSVSIGQHCRIRKAIVEECCHIPDGSVIGFDADKDRQRFHVTGEGVTLVTAEMLHQEMRDIG
ncbi:MAG: glucose-1-phosphate adenylyltransferase [Gammaproteobacteria bacterium]|nr:glucose-1-phosphate adenylyltransferase [Gammaproteobacteria bacterium]